MIRSLISPFKVGSRYWCLHWISPRTYWDAVREFCQRGTRSYADTDIWTFGTCETTLPSGFLMRLSSSEKGRTYPGEACKGASTPEEWYERLNEIEEGFRAARVLEELNTLLAVSMFPWRSELQIWSYPNRRNGCDQEHTVNN